MTGQQLIYEGFFNSRHGRVKPREPVTHHQWLSILYIHLLILRYYTVSSIVFLSISKVSNFMPYHIHIITTYGLTQAIMTKECTDEKMIHYVVVGVMKRMKQKVLPISLLSFPLSFLLINFRDATEYSKIFIQKRISLLKCEAR